METNKISDSKIAWDSAEETQRIEIYETVLSKAWSDGVISIDEKTIIDTMRQQLDISDEEHDEIEMKILTSKVEIINCPKCSVEIQVEYIPDEKISLQCTSCNAKGKINNPYLEKKRKGLKIIKAHEQADTSLPIGKRVGADSAEEMAFMCPHCDTSFETVPTEDPQKIPCPSCSKEVRIIKPITFECPFCNKTFPSVVQSDSKEMECPFCSQKMMLIK